MSRLRFPSRRRRSARVSGGRPCLEEKMAKASTWSGMLSTMVPSRSKIAARNVIQLPTMRESRAKCEPRQ
jgi:hypothetical protein